MSRQSVRDTAAELGLRRALHRAGFRYRLHRRPVPGVRREADLVFPRERVAVFIDGCFWHGCPEHKGMPRRNAVWWRAKITRNSERDAETDALLRSAGWHPVRVWEHEDPEDAAARIRLVVLHRRHLGG
jgi:DNA mismatch endonuclease, patch repair protein